jgi:hypothetical protein
MVLSQTGILKTDAAAIFFSSVIGLLLRQHDLLPPWLSPAACRLAGEFRHSRRNLVESPLRS